MSALLPPVTLVGRTQELTALTRRLADATAGRGGIALLAGEPGIGKTRLAEELAGVAERQGARVLWGRTFETEGAPALWPWVELLRSWVQSMGSDAGPAAIAPISSDMMQLIPELRALLPDMPPRSAVESAEARFRLMESVVRFLINIASEQPTVLIIEDLHWADAPSLLLFEFLARYVDSSRLLLVGTYRDVEARRGSPLARALGNLAQSPHVTRIELTGLSTADAGQVLTELVHSAPPAAMVATLADQSDGNPLFLIELARLLAASGGLTTWDGSNQRFGVPQTVRDVLGRRLEHLSAECVQLLSLAAIFGRTFELDVVGAAGDVTGSTLLNLVEEAEAARMIEAAPGAAGSCRFTHGLVREALYDEMPTIRRARLHLRIAEAIERLHKGGLEDYVAALAAHYRTAALASADARPKSVLYGRRAGDAAMAVYAWEEAAAQLRSALPFIAPDDLRTRCEVLLALGEAQDRLGERDAAKATFLEAAGEARRLRELEHGQPAHAATLLARAALGFGGTGVALVQRDQRQVALLEEALDAVSRGEGDEALHASLLARLALALYWTPQRPRSEPLSRDAVAIARRASDPRALITALHVRRYVLSGMGHLAERLDYPDEMVALAESSGDVELVLHGLRWRIVDRLMLGDMAIVDAAVDQYGRLAQRLHQPYYRWYAALYGAMRALSDGRFAEAETLAGQALDLGRQAGDADADAFFMVQLWAVREEQGRLAELEPSARELADRYATIVAYRSRLAALYAEIGQPADARRELEAAMAGAGGAEHEYLARLAGEGLGLVTIVHVARTALSLLDMERVTGLYDALLPYAAHNVVSGAALASIGPASHWLGVLAAALGRYPEATDHFEAALAMATRLASPPQVAATRCAYAAAMLEGGRPGAAEQARSLLNGALGTARELGMVRLTRQIERTWAEASGAGHSRGALSGPRAASSSPCAEPELPDGLTVREAEILRLVAAGHTNAEIAALLVLSPGTVKRHAENIYTKIGARRRVDATAYALRHGLIDR